MPFEKHSYILAGNIDWPDMVNWLNGNLIDWNVQGNIISFKSEQDESFFLLRYYNGQT